MKKATVSTYGKLKGQAYEFLRQALLSGDFAARQQISDLELSRRIGIGRTPVREALHLLHKDGLVDFVPRHGWFVPSVSLEEVMEVYDLCEVLEGLAAARACHRISADLLKELEDRYRSQMKVAAAPGYLNPAVLEEHYQTNRRLHGVIAEAGAGPILKTMLQNLADRIGRILARERHAHLTSEKSKEFLRQLCMEHLTVVLALSAGPSKSARRAMEDHLRNSRQRYLENINGRHRS
jgi:DNA-binding GntR family transcriptional regulator